MVLSTQIEKYFYHLKKGYDDIVPWNRTLNVTRNERIVMESGVLHWQTRRKQVLKSKSVPKVSCKDYLKMLDEKQQKGSSIFATGTKGTNKSMPALLS